MKLVLFFAFVFVLVSFSRPANPLQDTRWVFDQAVLHFSSSDTAILEAEGQKLNAGLYQVHDSILTWSDIAGGPLDCDPDIKGDYVFKIKNDTLSFIKIKDDCDGRGSFMPSMVLTRKKD